MKRTFEDGAVKKIIKLDFYISISVRQIQLN
jgi:hypothetical protein